MRPGCVWTGHTIGEHRKGELIHMAVEFDFYFMRHGESESNIASGMAAGANFDAPMTERGHRQAEALGRRLAQDGVRFHRIYSSSMVRAFQTVEGILRGMGRPDREFEQVDEIMERQIPAWRGRRLPEVWTPEVVLSAAMKGMWFQPADGESYRSVERRVSGWIEDEFLFNPVWLGSGGRHTIGVVFHGDAMRSLFHYVMGFNDRLTGRVRLDNCSISRFRFDSGAWSVISINDASHTLSIGDVNRERDGYGAGY